MRSWNPIYIENSKVPVWLSYLSPINIEAITLFFFVLSRNKLSDERKRHEYIHFQQMLETFLIGFVILYYWDYLKGYLKYKNGRIAYYSIRAEQEAHHRASLPFYTNERKRWQWIWDYKV